MKTRRHECACCHQPMITTTAMSLCGGCRLLARQVKCPLCSVTCDPYDGPSRRRYSACRDCRTIYRHTRGGTWTPMLHLGGAT